jgi:hypothetical protein
MHHFFKEFTPEEHKVFASLNTPQKIQDFLESIPINFEKKGETLMSPRRVIQERSAHCFEGALFASAVLLYHGKLAIILDLKTVEGDQDHVVTLYKHGKKWGAISKTNHAVLRFRDALYNSPREIVMSYFHEYFLDSGIKTLRSYATYNLNKVSQNWITDEKDLWYMDKLLDKVKHIPIIPKNYIRNLRKADPIEIKVGKITNWKK